MPGPQGTLVRLRRDEEGVASTVAVMFALIIALLFISAAIVAVAPVQQKDAEYATSLAAQDALARLRATILGPVVPNLQYSASVPLGTPAVSPFSSTSDGTLSFIGDDSASTSLSFTFVPTFRQGQVTKIDQEVIIVMDSSGSMSWNDPGRLRIAGAKEYIGRLTCPDRVAIVDFDSVARLTRANVGGAAHHLYTEGHNCMPNFVEPQSDVDTIDQSGNTNIGAGIQVANDELITNGNPRHAWVEIVLTDGQNNFAWQDALARSEAQRARANNITIFTIGLSSQADAGLLTEVAETTGGTYYAAPTAASIRWIYYEISRRYQGAIVCGNLWTDESARGSLNLELRNRQFPQQTFRFESGGVSLEQVDGSAVREGFPLSYTPKGGGAGSMYLTLVHLVGEPFSTSGAEYEFVSARVLSESVDDYPVTNVPLNGEAAAIASMSAEVQYWADQGAATQPAAAAVRGLLDQAQASTSWGYANASAGALTYAKFNVDRAQAQLSATIVEVDNQRNARTMQNWLAQQTKDAILSESCRLGQWTNWYDGITVTIVSPVAPAWVTWFNQTFRELGGTITFGLSGTTAVVTIHAIDQLTVARRLVHVSVS